MLARDLAQCDGELRFGQVFSEFLPQQVTCFGQRQPPDVHPLQQIIIDLAVRADSGDGARVEITQNFDLQTVARAQGERRGPRLQPLWARATVWRSKFWVIS